MEVNTTVNKVNIYDHGLRRAKASVKSARTEQKQTKETKQRDLEPRKARTTRKPGRGGMATKRHKEAQKGGLDRPGRGANEGRARLRSELRRGKCVKRDPTSGRLRRGECVKRIAEHRTLNIELSTLNGEVGGSWLMARELMVDSHKEARKSTKSSKHGPAAPGAGRGENKSEGTKSEMGKPGSDYE